MNAKIIQNLLTILNQVKYFHWGTNSYSRHKALGKAYSTLDALIDDFVEIFLGKYGKDLPSFNIKIRSEQDLDLFSALNEMGDFLSNDIQSYLSESDTDLMNIRDEMLAIINKTKYLFTLN
jgi:hypothetical protein